METELEKELRVCVKGMEAASALFYAAAIRTGNHAFIEWTGLINEYIKLCEAAAAQGIDFRFLNIHCGKHLPMRPHNLHYIQEKLDCIYGLDVLASPGKQS